MGSVSLTGLIGNVTKDVFNADTAIATVRPRSERRRSRSI